MEPALRHVIAPRPPATLQRFTAPAHAVVFYVDGGLLGPRNPSPEGVFWSVFCQPPGAVGRVVVARRESRAHHTNNDAEWLAVREALLHAQAHYAERVLVIYSDSQLIVRQFSGVWRAKLPRHHAMCLECRALASAFPECHVSWRPRRFMVERLGH